MSTKPEISYILMLVYIYSPAWNRREFWFAHGEKLTNRAVLKFPFRLVSHYVGMSRLREESVRVRADIGEVVPSITYRINHEQGKPWIKCLLIIWEKGFRVLISRRLSSFYLVNMQQAILHLVHNNEFKNWKTTSGNHWPVSEKHFFVSNLMCQKSETLLEFWKCANWMCLQISTLQFLFIILSREFDFQTYLGFDVSETQFTPRLELSAHPYAFNPFTSCFVLSPCFTWRHLSDLIQSLTSTHWHLRSMHY